MSPLRARVKVKVKVRGKVKAKVRRMPVRRIPIVKPSSMIWVPARKRSVRRDAVRSGISRTALHVTMEMVAR